MDIVNAITHFMDKHARGCIASGLFYTAFMSFLFRTLGWLTVIAASVGLVDAFMRVTGRPSDMIYFALLMMAMIVGAVFLVAGEVAATREEGVNRRAKSAFQAKKLASEKDANPTP